MTDRHQQKPYPLRMSDELRAKLEAAAKDGLRSLHAEILSRLEASFAQPEASSQRRGLSSLAEINSMSDLANRAKTDEELAEYMRSSGLSAAMSNSVGELWKERERAARENLEQLISQTIGSTVQDALKEFQEQERKERERLFREIASSVNLMGDLSVAKEYAARLSGGMPSTDSSNPFPATPSVTNHPERASSPPPRKSSSKKT